MPTLQQAQANAQQALDHLRQTLAQTIAPWLIEPTHTRKGDPPTVGDATIQLQDGSILHRAGYSEKYGQVYVARHTLGHGFDDPDEPCAIFRAADAFAGEAMARYAQETDDAHTNGRISHQQNESVRRQLTAFLRWRLENPSMVRKPGATR